MDDLIVALPEPILCVAMNQQSDLDAVRALWDALPHGALVIDSCGTIRMVNDRALQMTGWSSGDDVVGRPVFDFVEADDVGFVAAGLARGDDFSGVVLGPFRIRYRHRDGAVRWTECWAYEAPPDLGFDGHVLTLLDETVADGLSVAARQIAAGEPLETTLSTTAAALGAFPVAATASILSLDAHRIVSSSGTWPLDLPPSEGSSDAPWERCILDGVSTETPVNELPDIWRREAARHGFGAVWVRALDVDGRRGVLVMWRRSAVPPSPNQHRNIDDAVGIARLAWSQHDHRSRLAEAAQTDHLTGAFNRAKLDATIASGIVPAGVVYIDLDDFKSVNDRHGHHAGDLVLQEVTSRLRRVIDDRDQLFRVGGDEFVIIARRSVTGAVRHTADLAAAIVDAVDQRIDIDGILIEITATVGATDNPHSELIAPLLHRADEHLLTAKQAGKHRWHAEPQPASS